MRAADKTDKKTTELATTGPGRGPTKMGLAHGPIAPSARKRIGLPSDVPSPRRWPVNTGLESEAPSPSMWPDAIGLELATTGRPTTCGQPEGS
jgi:hypothetical protein